MGLREGTPADVVVAEWVSGPCVELSMGCLGSKDGKDGKEPRRVCAGWSLSLSASPVLGIPFAHRMITGFRSSLEILLFKVLI